MTVTFSTGQFFHPIYGWFDKEPDFKIPKNRGWFIYEPIGEEHRIKPGSQMYEFLNNSEIYKRFVEQMEERVAQRAAVDPGPAYVYEPRDLSYYLDGSTKYAGSYDYRFVYKDNTVSVEIDFKPDGNDAIDVAAYYERHRAKILDLKKQGFHDDAINMLITELDKKFVNARCVGIELQLQYYSALSYDSNHAREATKALFQEYLRIRYNSGSMENALAIAGENIIRKGLLNSRVDVTLPDARKLGMSQSANEALDRMDKLALIPYSPPLKLDPNRKSTISSEPAALNHIRNIDRIVDFSNNATMSDIEKEARSLSIVFRVRGNQMIDYARRYEELMGHLDTKLENGEISAAHYDRYIADLNTAFTKTYNLNIKGQAMAAGLSEGKATELAMAFSEEYIKVRSQTSSEDINPDKIANAALQQIAAQGWPSFSLYSSENRAEADFDDPWYAIMSEDALYWQKVPEKQPFARW